MLPITLNRKSIAFITACGIAALGAAAVAPLTPVAARATLVDPGRPADDIAQDAVRKPGMMVQFARIKRGATIVELLPGEGYFTRVFSNAVGPKGKVLAWEPKTSEAMTALAADKRRSNVTPVAGAIDAMAPAGTADVVWTSRNYHDLKSAKRPADTAQRVNAAAFAALKPGGYYVVLDHSAATGSGTRDCDTLHRIDAEAVKAEVVAAGFVFDGESPLLANAADSRSAAVFDPAIRGHTDQFVLRFKKAK